MRKVVFAVLASLSLLGCSQGTGSRTLARDGLFFTYKVVSFVRQDVKVKEELAKYSFVKNPDGSFTMFQDEYLNDKHHRMEKGPYNGNFDDSHHVAAQIASRFAIWFSPAKLKKNDLRVDYAVKGEKTWKGHDVYVVTGPFVNSDTPLYYDKSSGFLLCIDDQDKSFSTKYYLVETNAEGLEDFSN